MSSSALHNLAGRLSLRKPQRDALEILENVLGVVSLEKGADLRAALEGVQALYPHVQDFEREFPSLCFSLATGVGKTRLMGAFIAYLYAQKNIRNFFVLAPNLTVYNKLIADFTPGTPKYVFRGLSEFSFEPPILITGDNYAQTDWEGAGLFGKIRINIFNIAKINSEVRGGREPRIKRFQEVLGEGYFQYLAGLPDLVLLMDESHRYRASAGVRAINDLRPVLGLELTATPYVETPRGAVPFRNVVQDYPLGQAMRDGFVKEPAVVTRKDFVASSLTPDEIEEMKLMDGARLHEAVKADLETYARERQSQGVARVKPFVLVIARDTLHASSLTQYLGSNDFYRGRYAGKVLQVDSSQTGVAEEKMVEYLLEVEKPENPIEIVVHVNMLKEGWDVTNLYTIVPLRAASARILIEQSIGRGLRLPYGKRTGEESIDRLSIVAHDRFQEIVEQANRSDSLIRLEHIHYLEDLVPEREVYSVRSEPLLNTLLGMGSAPGPVPMDEEGQVLASKLPSAVSAFTLEEGLTVRKVYDAIQELGKKPQDVPTLESLLSPSVQRTLFETVRQRQTSVQGTLGLEPMVVAQAERDLERLIARTAELVVARTIGIPRILLMPLGEVKIGFRPFLLTFENFHYQEPNAELLAQYLRDNKQVTIGVSSERSKEEKRLEDYLVRALMDFSDIDYAEHADLLYDLAGQVVEHLRGQGHAPTHVADILKANQKPLARFVYAQMVTHRFEHETQYEAVVHRGYVPLLPSAYSVSSGERLSIHTPPPPGTSIRSLLYGGFARGLYPETKFHSNQERILAEILERESLKWFRPALGQFQIHYRSGPDTSSYQPDFVAETEREILMLEVKDASKLTDSEVLEKASAAREWCEQASKHALEHGGKPWRYALLRHDEMGSNRSLEGLVADGVKACESLLRIL